MAPAFRESARAKVVSIYLDGELVRTLDVADVADRVVLADLVLGEALPNAHSIRARAADGRTLDASPQVYAAYRPVLFAHPQLGASLGLFRRTEQGLASEPHQFLAGAHRIDVLTAPAAVPLEVWSPLPARVGGLDWAWSQAALEALSPAVLIEVPRPDRGGAGRRGRRGKARGWHVADLVGSAIRPSAVERVVFVAGEATVEVRADQLTPPSDPPVVGESWALLKRNNRGQFVVNVYRLSEAQGLEVLQRLREVERVDLYLNCKPVLLVAAGEWPEPVTRAALEALPTSTAGSREGWDLHKVVALSGLPVEQIGACTLRSNRSQPVHLERKRIEACPQVVRFNRRDLIAFDLLGVGDWASARARDVVRIDVEVQSASSSEQEAVDRQEQLRAARDQTYDQDPQTRVQGLRALAVLGAVAEVLDTLQHETDLQVLESGLRLLGEHGSPGDMEHLLSWASRGDRAGKAARRSIRRISQRTDVVPPQIPNGRVESPRRTQ